MTIDNNVIKISRAYQHLQGKPGPLKSPSFYVYARQAMRKYPSGMPVAKTWIMRE